MDIDLETGRVLKVHAESQAERMAVRGGMVMERIGGFAYSSKLLQIYIGGQHPYTVTFQSEEAVALLTRTFKPGTLGLDVEETSGCVGAVTDRGQAQCHGVETGMVIHNIDGYAFTLGLLDRYAKGRSDYTVTFLKYVKSTRLV